MFLAACLLDPDGARPYVAELTADHFERPEHQRLHAYLTGNGEPEETAALRAELWATAEQEGIGPDQTRGLALELQERRLDREIAALESASMSRDDERRHAELVQLQSRIRAAVAELA
jgi:hypothetical protein